MMKNLNKISQVINENDSFLIASHYNPDGDAVGSMLAMGYLLKSLGKRISFFNESSLPDKFSWLEWPEPLSSEYIPGKQSWIIVLDCGDFERSGSILPQMAVEPIINIDHHIGNPEFGSINWVNTGSSSVGEMIAELADHLEVELSGPMAQGIYLSLVSDTGFFSFGNTSAHSLELAARLVQNGINPGKINPMILNQWTVGRLRLHGMAMDKATFHFGGKVGIISVTREMLNQTRTTADDCEGLVSAVRNVKGVKVAVSIREDEPGKIKFSLRSSEDVNVQLMASDLGGGGHKNASGGILEGTMEQAHEKLMEVISRHLA
ncbi:MAG: bifunctional oligoribonuclease/PAP phosphatase NrnA [Desulfonatronovibrio sp.]